MIKAFALALLISACSHGPKIEGSSVAVQDGPLDAKKDIFGLRLAHNGSILLFISADGGERKRFQLYALDIATKKETRITHNDGDVIAVEEHPNGTHLIYSSSTDEIKEKAQMDVWAEKRTLTKKDFIYQTPSELYLTRFDGSDIRRITNSPGYDSEPSVHRFGRYILFVSTREGPRSIYRTGLSGGISWRVADTKSDAKISDKKETFFPKLSPDAKQLIWLESTETRLELMRGGPDMQKPEPLLQFAVVPSGPSWSPTGKSLLFAAKAIGAKRAQIWEFDLEQKCVLMLLDRPGLEAAEPVLSPDSKILYFLEKTNASVAISQWTIPQIPQKDGECSKSVMF